VSPDGPSIAFMADRLALDADGQAALEADLVALLRSQDLGSGNGLVVPGEYLETMITR
jgi:hypothetical protein